MEGNASTDANGVVGQANLAAELIMQVRHGAQIEVFRRGWTGAGTLEQQQILAAGFARCTHRLIQFGNRRHGVHGHVQVQPRLASTHQTRRRPTLGRALRIEPDRQVAPIDQRIVVVRPIRNPVAVFRICRSLNYLRSCSSTFLSLALTRQKTADQ